MLFLGWFGPRGLATIVLAGVVIEGAELAGIDVIVAIGMVTVGLSVFAHGVTAWHGSEAYANWAARTEPAAAEPMPRGTAAEVQVPARFRAPGMPADPGDVRQAPGGSGRDAAGEPPDA